MRGSEAVIRLLDKVGVEVVFGLTGDTSLPLYEAAYDLTPNFKHIVTRDERSASYMADAYARFSGRVGVCEGPSGGGVTYIVPGVAEANLSSVPMVCFTTDIDIRTRGRGTLTEMDQDTFFRPITAWTKTPGHAQELPSAIREAFRRASTGRMGATHVGLPLNVQEAEVDDGDVYIDPRYSRYPACRIGPEPDSVRGAARRLLNSRRPILVAGAGVIRSEAWPELESLAGLLGAPVATSISGKGSLAETNPYCLGVIGSNGGLPYRHEFIRRADLLFYVGCHTGSVTTENWTLPTDRSTQIMQLDIDPTHIGCNYQVVEGIVADAKLGLAALVEELADGVAGRSAAKWDPSEIANARKACLSRIEEFHSDALPIRPERFLTELSLVLPEDAVILTDAGTPTPYLAAYYRVPTAGRWFAAPRAHGPLGYALPASVGAYYAKPYNKVVGIMGDGSFGISVGELETIARLQAPILLIVLTNSCYGWVKAGQRKRGGKYFGVDFTSTDHARVARAYDLEAVRVEAPENLNPALCQAMKANGPMLVDVVIQPLHEARAPVSKWIA